MKPNGSSKTLFFSTAVQTAVTVAALTLVAQSGFASGKVTGDSGVEQELKLKAGDEPGNEVKALKTEMLVMRSEKRALEDLQRLQKKYKNTRMEPEILFRLAELYMRRARTERFFEVHRNSEEVMSFAPALVKAASEAAEIKKAIEIYTTMQSKFSTFRSIDIVIFNNAYAYQQIGNDKAAEALYLKLIKNHADSVLVADSYLAIGEINFVHRDFKLALQNFLAVRAFPKARAYPYGLYKAAWCYYNLQDATSGLKQLEEVVAYGHDLAKTGASSKLDLRKEALGDMALFYGDVKQASEAVDYFRGQARDLDAVPYILRLSELYKRHSRYPDVETVLTSVLAKLPNSDSLSLVHEELVWNNERMRKRPEAVAQLSVFDKFCQNQSGVVPVAPKKIKGAPVEPSPQAVCLAKIAEVSKKLATKWHAQWKKQGGDDSLAKSTEQSYQIYLKYAGATDSDLPQIRYEYAELQFARGQFREASVSYALVNTYGKEIKIDAKISHDSAYGAIVSLEKAVGAAKWSDADEKNFQALGDLYVEQFPSGQFALDVRFKRAFIAYEKEHYDEAAIQFKKIGWNENHKSVNNTAAGSSSSASNGTPEKVLKAQDLYLDILNIKKDYTGLKEAAKSLLVHGTDTARIPQVEKIYREAYFSEIQQIEEKGNLPGAVEAYKKFALENAASPLAAKAWWNASQLQFKLGDAEGGANTCYQMHKLFPASSNGKDCLTRAAQTFEAMARLDLAARVLLNLAIVEPEKQDHWRELAADFFALSGQKARAISMYFRLVEGNDGKKQPAVKVPLLEKAAVLANETGDRKTLDILEIKFSQMGVEPQTSRLVVEQAEEALNKGDASKAFNLSKRIVGKSTLPKGLQARARIVQARVLEDEYRHQSIKARVERIGTVLAIKTEKLEKAQKAYQSAIAYADPEQSIRALRLLAGCYLDYSHSVRNMSLPGSVAAADQKAFSAEIEQLSIPMEEKGIEAMNQALETAKKSQLHDGSVAQLQSELDKLNLKTNVSAAPTPIDPGVYVPSFERAPASKVGL